MSQLMENILDEDRSQIHQICQKQLGGVWNNVTQTQLIIKRFTKGYINKLFYCELPDSIKCNDSYKSVVVKIGKQSEEFFDPLVSTINTLVLSEKKIAPKVYKIFNGGMISQYIDGRSYVGNDDKDYAIVSLLAQKLAKFHSIQMPIRKDGSEKWLNMICEVWFNKCLRKSLNEGILCQEIRKQNRKTFLKLNFVEELLWMKKAIIAFNSPVVFSHCDFNRGNILIRDKNHNLDLYLIDFDFSIYNYRGLDIGRYFSSWGQKDPLFGFEQFPTDDQMLVFINAYIQESVQLLGNSFSKLEINSKENLIKEAKLFTLISYLIDVLFCLWTVNEDITKSEEYLEKGETRFNGYYVLKNKFLEENSISNQLID